MNCCEYCNIVLATDIKTCRRCRGAKDIVIEEDQKHG